MATLTIPLSRLEAFRRTHLGKRWGQEFYDYMQFHKVTNPENKAFVERLYQEPLEGRARAMVQERLDLCN